MLRQISTFAFLFISLIKCAIAVNMPYKDCAKGEIQSLRVEPCPSQPCKFNVGDKVDVILEFIANQNASDVKLYANLRTGGLFNYEISYKGIDQNACNNGSDSNKLSCPLVKGKSYKFIISQVVPYASRFNVFRYATWKLVGPNGRNLICADIALNKYTNMERFFYSS